MEIHKPQTNEFLNFSTLRSYTHKPINLQLLPPSSLNSPSSQFPSSSQFYCVEGNRQWFQSVQ